MAVETRELALEHLFKALADRTRLRILGLLAAGEVCVCDLHDSLGEPQPKVSRHLAYLRRAGLVSARKDGLWVHYRRVVLDDPVLETVADAAIHAVGHLRTAERDRKKLAARVPGMPPAIGPTPCGPGCCGSQERDEPSALHQRRIGCSVVPARRSHPG